MKSWGNVFLIAGIVYIAVATIYNFLGSGTRQPWDNPDLDDVDVNRHIEGVENPQTKDIVNSELSSQKVTSQF